MDLLTYPSAASASAPGIPSESSRGESSVNAPGKTRSACNRCHAQKLKCVRRAGQASSCERCFRLQTSCRFDPRAVRSSLKLSHQLAVEITMEDPLSVPAYMPMPVQPSDTSIAGVSELGWLSLPGASTYPDAGRGQFSLYTANQFCLRINVIW
jgi:hypothetical protein